ncbi:MAG: hypothetical protein OXG43_01585 [Chloroflexi bacterium]|nr:hypothetical protein [Chloroflexota bacterium]
MSLSSVTLGSTSIPTYASVAEANAYMLAEAGPQRTTWNAAETDAKRRALVTATRALDRLPWRGTKAQASQATAWPRAGIGTTGVPAGIEAAAILIAADLVRHPRELTGDAMDVKREQIGPKEAEYFRHLPDPLERTLGLDLAAIVRPYVAQWLALAPASPYAVGDAT